MGLYTGLVLYLVVWWLVLFMVLPWGIQPIESADVARGHASGAPRASRMVVKGLVTTAIAGVVWGIIYAVMELDVISFR